jgi:hypothetical protein
MARFPTEVARYKKTLVRLPADIIDRLQTEALKQERSLNGQIVYALRDWCECHCEPEPAASPRRTAAATP